MKKWSEVAQSCLTLCDPVDCSLSGSSVSRQGHWSGLPFLSPGIFPTQGSNPGLLHCRQMLYCLSHQRRPSLLYLSNNFEIRKWETYDLLCFCFFFFFQYSFGYLGSDEISCHFMLYFSFFAKNSFKYWWKIYGIHHFELYVYVCMYICLLIRKH